MLSTMGITSRVIEIHVYIIFDGAAAATLAHALCLVVALVPLHFHR